MRSVIIIILIILLIVGVEMLSGLITMGIINLFCWVFGLSFSITYLQGLAISLVLWSVSTCFIRRD